MKSIIRYVDQDVQWHFVKNNASFLALWKEGTPHDALLWCIASIQQKLYLHKGTFIEYRRHDSNASKSISHGYKYKVNEINRTIQVNNWYLNAFDVDFKSVN